MVKAGFHLCEELIIEVLSQLPLKTLARFKCVSKQWYYLITNTIKAIKIPKLLIMSRSTENDCYSFRSLDHKIREEKMCGPKEEHLLEGPNIIVHSSCNGLVLLQINKILFVWNPLTKLFTKELKHSRLIREGYVHSLADLCFDQARKEYKVVLVVSINNDSWHEEYFYVAKCRARSWVKMKVPFFVKNVFQGPFFKGYRHWVSKGHNSYFTQSDPPNYIFYFNPSTNEFIKVATPQPKKGDTDSIIGLGVLDGCLCMTRLNEPQNFVSGVEFLAMKEYGNGDSWDIMFVISNVEFRSINYRMEPLFKTMDGEVLLNIYTGMGWSIQSYDVRGNSFRDIVAQKNRYQFIIYEESTFSCHTNVGPRSWKEKINRKKKKKGRKGSQINCESK